MDNLELMFRFEGGRSKRDNLELDDGEDLPDIEDMKIEVSLKEQKKDGPYSNCQDNFFVYPKNGLLANAPVAIQNILRHR